MTDKVLPTIPVVPRPRTNNPVSCDVDDKIFGETQNTLPNKQPHNFHRDFMVHGRSFASWIPFIASLLYFDC